MSKEDSKQIAQVVRAIVSREGIDQETADRLRHHVVVCKHCRATARRLMGNETRG